MRSIGDNRGQSVQVGAVLLFGILIVFLAIWQAQVVPTENGEVEFQHSLDAQEDMQQLRSEIRSVAGTGTTRSTTVELGTRYPTRVAFVNPPPATGSLSTTEGTVSIANVSADSTNGFWNGTTRNYTTNTIAYEPRYSEYKNPPRTVYEHGFLYNEFDREETQLAESSQQLVRTSGNATTIDLVALRGSIDADRTERESIDLYPNSASTQTVPVTANGTDEPINITIPTRNQAIWNERLSAVEGTAIESVTNVSDSAIQIQLNATDDAGELRSYRLRMAEVGLAEEASQEPAYIVPVGSETVNPGDEITAEVRDRYNNPIEDARVSVNSSARIEGDGNETTDSSGQARFTVADDADEGTIELSIDSAIDCDGCDAVTYTVEEQTAGGSGSNDGTGDINPEDPSRYQLVYNTTELLGNDNVSVTLDNPAADDPNVTTTITINALRLPFYYTAQSGGGGGNDPATDAGITFRDVNSSNTTTVNLNSIPGSRSDVDFKVTGKYLEVEFDFDNKPEGDFFIFSLRSQNEVSTFYIAIPA